MKSTGFLLQLFFVICQLNIRFVANAQSAPPKEWDYAYGGTGWDYFTSFKQTKDGGYILGGSSSSDAGGNKSQDLFGGADAWVIKINPSGTIQWDVDLGGTDWEEDIVVLQTSDGGYAVGSSSRSPASGNKTSASVGGFDYWIVRLDSNGVKLWDKDFGGAASETLSCLQQTSDGGFVLGGYSFSGAGFDKTEPNHGLTDFWIVKTDAYGNKLWDKSFGGNSYDYLLSLQQTDDDNYIFAGTSESSAGFDKTDSSRGAEDCWLIKTDAFGNKIWDKTYGGSSGDGTNKVIQTPDGGFILAGFSGSDSSGEKTQDTKGMTDLWVLKTDSTGNKMWDADYGGFGQEFAAVVCASADGGFLVGTCTNSGAGGDITEPNQGDDDYWIVKIDSSGSIKWDKRFGGLNAELLYDLQSTSDGGFIIGGSSFSDSTGDKTQPSFGGWDYWIIKLVGDIANMLPASLHNTIMFSLFPNPTEGNVSARFYTEGKDDVQFIIYDHTGRKVFMKTGKIHQGNINTFKVDLGFLATGIYFFEVRSGSDSGVQKFAIQK